MRTKEDSSMLTREQAFLLSLCVIDDLNWYLLAREARRPGGLERLRKGEISERLPHTDKARKLLQEGLSQAQELLRRVEERVAPAEEIGAKITTVLDEDYPLNLRSIFNLPPFLFYLGELKDEDVRAVAVVGTRQPTKEG